MSFSLDQHHFFFRDTHNYRSVWSHWLKRILILSIIFISACSSRQGVKVGDIPPPVAPSAEEKQTAQAFVRAHVSESGYQPLSSGAKVQRVRKIIDRINRAAGFAPGTFPIEVVDAGEEVNAMAVNSASIVVYSGLLDKVSDDEEVAVVLSHEIGHILGRHSQEEGQKERATAVEVGSSIFGAAASIATSLAGFGGVSDIAGDIAEGTTSAVGYGAFVRSFDREQEYEADHIGLMLMAKAGYNPEKAISFWERADEIFGGETTKVMSFFSTHPASSNRRKHLEEAMPFAVRYYQEGKTTKSKSDE